MNQRFAVTVVVEVEDPAKCREFFESTCGPGGLELREIVRRLAVQPWKYKMDAAGLKVIEETVVFAGYGEEL